MSSEERANSPTPAISAEEGAISFKKKSRNVAFFRGVKRKAEPKESDDSDEYSSSDDETVVVKKDRRNVLNPLVQSTSSFHKKRTFRARSDAPEDDEEERLAAVSVVYKSDKTAESLAPKDMGATATVEVDTERDRDAQAIFEKARKLNEDTDLDESKVYKGMNNYKQYLQKKDTALGNASSSLVRQGPVRAPDNLRSTIRWDYQPDVCKDYKETGFCGFGLSCKFLHDRSDYKHGWQIELEYQKGTYTQEDHEDYEIKEEEQLPFKCLFCRKSFKTPVVTKCKHYFCEACALDHYRKSTRCYVCGEPTNGIFNPAKEIIKMLENAKNKEDNEDSKSEQEDDSGQEEDDDETADD